MYFLTKVRYQYFLCNQKRVQTNQVNGKTDRQQVENRTLL